VVGDGPLALCATLLALCAALMWSYLPVTSTIPSSSVPKDQAATEAVVSGLKEQQVLTNIRDELRARKGAASTAPALGASLKQWRC
jgi:hypothetical protein